MESNRINASNSTTLPSSSFLMEKKPKADSHAPKFMQALELAVDNFATKTNKAAPAALTSYVRPRSHLELVSLNSWQTSYVPEAAALEKIGSSRIVPMLVGS